MANPFWSAQAVGRAMAANAFFEHLGLIAGLVLVTLLAHRRPAGIPI